jgi:hypothetical protein
MTTFQILFLSLSLAFTWVEILRLGVTKPFNCMKCMTGWVALAFGIYYFGWHGWIYLFEGLFVGALFSAIQMRFL